MDLFGRLKEGLLKTRTQISSIVGTKSELNDDFYERLEDALVSADVGLDLSLEFISRLKKEVGVKGIKTSDAAYEHLKKMIALDLQVAPIPTDAHDKPHIILVVGVNGVGKTTTIGKLANELRANGKKVMLAACDTFRAGAIEQLKIWGQRSGADVVSQHEGADPASVAFDAVEAARARRYDALILDTAGRLHNKVNLMNELEKIVRVIGKAVPSAPHEILLVVDATTGQNALKQARVFGDSAKITGYIITKLDGTAKGGIALSLTRTLKIPIRKIGVGEAIEDLQDFSSNDFANAMFGSLS